MRINFKWCKSDANFHTLPFINNKRSVPKSIQDCTKQGQKCKKNNTFLGKSIQKYIRSTFEGFNTPAKALAQVSQSINMAILNTNQSIIQHNIGSNSVNLVVVVHSKTVQFH